jgi:tetratricopeptide (TPR) repeat protein
MLTSSVSTESHEARDQPREIVLLRRFGVRCRRSYLVTFVVFACALIPRTWGGGDERAEDAIKRGTEALAAQDYRQAIKLFEMANKSQHKACGPCYLGLASAYEGLQDVVQQLENANKALHYTSEAQGKARAHELKGEALLALANQDPRKLKEAEEEFRAAAELDGSDRGFILTLELPCSSNRVPARGKRN